jgi:hypothetical protein
MPSSPSGASVSIESSPKTQPDRLTPPPTRRRHRLVRPQNLRIRQHLRLPQRLLLAMPARHRQHHNHNINHPPHHQQHHLNPLLNGLHNNNHHNNQHTHPHHIHILTLPHHHRSSNSKRLRRRHHAPDRLLLDPRRRRPELPQISANFPLKRLSRPRDPLLRNNSRPVPAARRPAGRAHRHPRDEIVRQRG